ncbi:flagellar basal body P-ring formation chaperone FlgA [Candidatus Magnetomonas plexicatena]|uniref:flagellar basal body P-ring formation chaperone FlgA n=1 Tax=Candidatus Magnetomonas plexicatena TaxID=2552947 RepID=UPI001101D9F3|nr:flagellar basal body P-ring formation protein FlgA [Nitrospirales bacterium LBB_01]
MVTTLILTMLMTVWSPEEAVKTYVTEVYPWPDVEVSGVNPDIKFPDMPPVEIVLYNGAIPGRAMFAMKFSSGDLYYYEADVAARTWVIASARPLKKGSVLASDDISKTLYDVRRIPTGTITDESLVTGKMVNHTIPANRVLTTSLIETAPVVHKGREVIMVVKADKFTITMSGIAKEDGVTGQYIKVLNPKFKKIIFGKVIDSRTVSVDN